MFFVPLNKRGFKFCPSASPGANTICCVKRSCLSLFRARSAGGGFLKLTYLLINIYVNFGNVGNKKVGKGLGLYPPF